MTDPDDDLIPDKEQVEWLMNWFKTASAPELIRVAQETGHSIEGFEFEARLAGNPAAKRLRMYSSRQALKREPAKAGWNVDDLDEEMP
jgi:hypothetical protein